MKKPSKDICPSTVFLLAVILAIILRVVLVAILIIVLAVVLIAVVAVILIVVLVVVLVVILVVILGTVLIIHIVILHTCFLWGEPYISITGLLCFILRPENQTHKQTCSYCCGNSTGCRL